MTAGKLLDGRIKKLVLCFAGAAGAGALCASVPLSLDSDMTVDVPSGDTVMYSTLSGGAYTLTKTGGGTLVFETISNAAAKVVVSAGALDVRTAVPPKPAALESALIHLDATDLSTMTYTESNGVVYVSQWRDVNGGSLSLSALGYTSGADWRTNVERRPFITPSFRNGRGVMDLGAVMNRMTAEKGAGYGAAFTFSATCSTMREAFLVVGDTEDSKRSYVDYGEVSGYTNPRCAPLLGTWNLGATAAPFIRGSIASLNGQKNSSLIYASSTPGASCAWTLDGADVADPLTETLPDGLHLVEIRANADSGISFNSLGTERGYYFGGLRYGELAIFDSPLSADARAEVRAYLSARWLPVELAGLELGEGASLVLANDVTLRVAMFKASGAATVSGGGSLKIIDVDRTGEGLVTFAGNSQTIRPDASGLLPDMAFQSGGSITAVGMAAKVGQISVSGSFAKKGSGSLTVFDIDDSADIAVEEGVLSIDPLWVADLSWLHLDACITNSAGMEIRDDRGTNVVSRWYDVRFGTSRFAAHNDVTRAPWLRLDFQNGLPILDFGGLRISDFTQNTRGGWMQWNPATSSLRDVFTVASDTEDLDWNFDELKNNHGGYTVQWLRGAPFVGSGTPHFLRSNRPNDGSKRPGILLSTTAIYPTASVILDGESVAKDSEYPAGFHVLNIRTGMDASGYYFANDRNQIYGGTRIGEFVAFTNEVAPRVRSALNRGLMSKWLGGEKTLTQACGALSVAKGATMKAPYQALAPTGQASIDGSVSAGRLVLSANAQFGEDSSLSGDLELADGASIVFPSTAKVGGWTLSARRLVLDGGVVTISFAEGGAKPAPWAKVKLISFDSVEVNAPVRCNIRNVRVSVESDGLYAMFLPGGFSMTIR